MALALDRVYIHPGLRTPGLDSSGWAFDACEALCGVTRMVSDMI